MKVEKVREKDGKLELSVELDGKECDVELKLVLTDDGWRLDTPTY